MTAEEIQSMADRLIRGDQLSESEVMRLAEYPESDVEELMAAARRVTRHFKGKRIHTCTILNGKSGRCSEDCGFCSQSQSARSDISTYPLLPKETMAEAALAAARSGVDRFSVVTAGRALPREQVLRVAEMFAGLSTAASADGSLARTRWCASLGILHPEELRLLREAGVSRFHHNLETARSYFSHICSTHSYDERVETIRAAREAGMSVCAGGIFGLGETDAQAAELALELRALHVDSVPMNFLIPVPGTRLENAPRITPRRCLKLIALFRMTLPAQDILICGGREDNLKEWHPLVLWAGANGIMTGNYLTRAGRTPEKDASMLDALDFEHGLRRIP